MNKHTSPFLSFRRWTSILGGLLLVVFGSFYFFYIPAKTEAVKRPAKDNLVLGRLAFSRQVTQMGQETRVVTSNPDGSDQFTLPTSTGNFAAEPAWSPDGTKIAYSAFAPSFPTTEIWVANANGTGETNLTNTEARESNASWAVTGKIAYEKRPSGGGTPEIWTMNADGGGQALFSGIMQPSPTGPAWSPDGMKLAFASGGEIWVINANGTNELRLTTNATTDADPAWSPDGAKIVFSRGTAGLATIDANGTNETPLTNLNDLQPAWSPDGTKIAFRRTVTPAGIYAMDANGGNQLRVVPDGEAPFPAPSVSNSHPAWQPVAQTPNTFNISGRITYNILPVSGVTVNLSGTTNAAVTTDAVGNYQFSGLPPGGNYTVSPSFPRHYFTPPNRSFNNLTSDQTAQNFEVLAVCVSGNCVKKGKIVFARSGEIFTINQDGTGLTNITNNPVSDNSPNWSPDGVKLVFSSFREGSNDIYRMNSEDDQNPTRLTDSPFSDTSPYYSPDGASIVFVSDRDGNTEIYKMNADGSNQVRLTNNTTSDAQPAFSPDGQKIVFRTTGPFPTAPKLWTMNADGSNPQQIPDNSTPFSSYGRPSYSPDGSKIIFTYSQDVQSQFSTGWTMNPDGTNRTQGPAGGFAGAYSPDGTKIVHVCCLFDNSYRLRTINVNGTGEQSLTPVASSSNSPDVPDWQGILVPRAPFDFDGDGRSDISFFRQAGGFWYLLRSTAGLGTPQWGLSDDKLVPADYDGDMKTDIAVWRETDGNFYILNSFDGTVRIENFGLPGDVPTGGDFDGDGKADVALYRDGAQSVFYYRGSMGNPQQNITSIPWGTTDDKPVAGDYDGDGRTDAAIFRPSSGTWYISQSSNGQLSGGNFGLADDRLVPADYDGDGKTDLAVFRAGIWYLLRSGQGFTSIQFGIAKDIPAPADYDGDGRADVTIFRDGVWWILNSQSGMAEAHSFGAAGDKPIPSAFVR